MWPYYTVAPKYWVVAKRRIRVIDDILIRTNPILTFFLYKQDEEDDAEEGEEKVSQNWSVLKSTGQAAKPKVHITCSVFWSEKK